MLEWLKVYSHLNRRQQNAVATQIVYDLYNYIRFVFLLPLWPQWGSIDDPKIGNLGYWWEIKCLCFFVRIFWFRDNYPYIAISLNYFPRAGNLRGEDIFSKSWLGGGLNLINTKLIIGMLTPNFDRTHQVLLKFSKQQLEGMKNGQTENS